MTPRVPRCPAARTHKWKYNADLSHTYHERDAFGYTTRCTLCDTRVTFITSLVGRRTRRIVVPGASLPVEA